MLQLQSSGTRVQHNCALPPLVVDNSETALKPISSYKPTHDLRISVLRVYLPTYYFISTGKGRKMSKTLGGGWMRGEGCPCQKILNYSKEMLQFGTNFNHATCAFYVSVNIDGV